MNREAVTLSINSGHNPELTKLLLETAMDSDLIDVTIGDVKFKLRITQVARSFNRQPNLLNDSYIEVDAYEVRL